MTFRELDAGMDHKREVDRQRYGPAALVCSIIANCHRDPDKRPEPFTVNDFMPHAENTQPEMMNDAQLASAALMIASMFGAEDLRTPNA